MDNILNKYQIKFGTKFFFGTGYEFINSTNDSLDAYLWDQNTVSRTTQLLSSIDKMLSYQDPNANLTSPTQGLALAVIKKSTTRIYDEQDKFYENENSSPDFELPTSDFKVIVEAWRDYLVSRGK